MEFVKKSFESEKKYTIMSIVEFCFYYYFLKGDVSMKIQKRGVSVKRHTQELKISGKWYTRKQAVKLARQGKIEGVTVVRGGRDGFHLRSLPGKKQIYDLETVVS